METGPEVSAEVGDGTSPNGDVRRSRRRFLLDGSMIQTGGGFTYLVNIVPHLARRAPGDHFKVLVRNRGVAEAIEQCANVEVELLPEAGLRERFRFVWVEASRRAAAWGADLYYSAGESVPLRAHCPVIATFQNPNVFTMLNQGWPLRERFRLRVLRILARLSARRCARVLFVSKDSAQWIGQAVGLAENKRAWLHHGIDTSTWRPSQRTAYREFPCILSVSSIYRYKNYVRLIDAYTLLAQRRPQVPDLVIIGTNLDKPYAQKMQVARDNAGPLAARIRILGGIPYQEIHRYFAGAVLFVFPSYLETFGIPIIEAMASGVPLVVSDIPVFREIAENAALYVDPQSPASIAKAMEQVLYVEGAGEILAKRGLERVQHFSWEQASERLLNLFESVLDERMRSQAQVVQRKHL